MNHVISFNQFVNEGRKPAGAPDWKNSSAPDANGKFRDLGVKALAAWLIKTRGGDLKKISGSLSQQVVFNRHKDPKYAEKMKKVRLEVYRKLGRKDLLEQLADPDQWLSDLGFTNYEPEMIAKRLEQKFGIKLDHMEMSQTDQEQADPPGTELFWLTVPGTRINQSMEYPVIMSISPESTWCLWVDWVPLMIPNYSPDELAYVRSSQNPVFVDLNRFTQEVIDSLEAGLQRLGYLADPEDPEDSED